MCSAPVRGRTTERPGLAKGPASRTCEPAYILPGWSASMKRGGGVVIQCRPQPLHGIVQPLLEAHKGVGPTRVSFAVHLQFLPRDDLAGRSSNRGPPGAPAT